LLQILQFLLLMMIMMLMIMLLQLMEQSMGWYQPLPLVFSEAKRKVTRSPPMLRLQLNHLLEQRRERRQL
jgi:hypothetical protein